MAAAAPPSSSTKNLSSCSSPLSGKPTNPNSRNSEISNPMRRSFTGTPFAKPSIIANQRGGFHPNTPTSSPSDHARRHSTSRENFIVTLRNQEDKENNNKDHKWKQARVRSPVSSNVAKNFMAPTVSAASKVNASPRKKLLAERNEPVRSSVSSLDAKSEDLVPKPEKGLHQRKEMVSSTLIEHLEPKSEKKLHQNKEVSFNSTITYMGEDEMFTSNQEHSTNTDELYSSSKCETIENDCVNLDPSFKIGSEAACPSPIPALAPLDADPSAPPYDPKTNYLSPRPQFLHYRPNPRIEVYLNKERDGKQLEEMYVSESLSDTDATEEESLSEDSQKESEDASSCDALKVEDDEKKEVEEEVEEELLVSEPNPCNMLEGVDEAKRVTKPSFFTRTKFTALILVLSITFLWVSFTNSPIKDPSVLNNLSLSELQILPRITEFTRENFEALAEEFQLWLARSLSRIHDMVQSFRQRKKLGALQCANLTILIEDGMVDTNFVFDKSLLAAEIKYENHFLGHTEEGEVDDEEDQLVESYEGEMDDEEDQLVESYEGSYEDTDKAVEFFEDTDEVVEEVIQYDSIEVSVEHGVPETEESHAIVPYETPVGDIKLQVITALEDDPVRTSTAAEIQPEVPDSSQLQSVDEMNPSASEPLAVENSLESLVLEDGPAPVPQYGKNQPEISDSRQFQSTDEMSSSSVEPLVLENSLESLADSEAEISAATLTLDGQKAFSTQAWVAISLLFLSLVTAAAFGLIKNRAPTKSNSARKEAPMTKKLECSPLSICAERSFQDRQSSRNWPTEVDMDGDSCPSEMSSFENSLSYSKKGPKGTKDSSAQSQETKPRKNYRRESLASSDYSMGSPSYGSFTTYEKIHSKLGSGDDEVITPVRRSSRIRKQVTSP